MSKPLKEIPKFNNETEEREFWTDNDSTEFVDWESAESVVLPKLKTNDRNDFDQNFLVNAR